MDTLQQELFICKCKTRPYNHGFYSVRGEGTDKLANPSRFFFQKNKNVFIYILGLLLKGFTSMVMSHQSVQGHLITQEWNKNCILDPINFSLISKIEYIATKAEGCSFLKNIECALCKTLIIKSESSQFICLQIVMSWQYKVLVIFLIFLPLSGNRTRAGQGRTGLGWDLSRSDWGSNLSQTRRVQEGMGQAMGISKNIHEMRLNGAVKLSLTSNVAYHFRFLYK